MYKYLILFFVFSFVSSGLHSQTVEQTYNSAKEKLTEGDVFQAKRLFVRAIFFTPQEKKNEKWMDAAVAFEAHQCFDEVISFVDSAIYYCNSSDIDFNNKLILLKVKSLLKLQENEQALFELDEYYIDKDIKQDSLSVFYKAVAYWQLGNIDYAKYNFLQFSELKNSKKQKEFNEIYKQIRSENTLNPNFAFILSEIIPGAGQLYSGSSSDALNSFLLNAVLFYFLYDLSVNYSWYSGLLSVYPWYERYKYSGAKKAKELAVEKNKIIKQEYLNKIIDILIN